MIKEMIKKEWSLIANEINHAKATSVDSIDEKPLLFLYVIIESLLFLLIGLLHTSSFVGLKDNKMHLNKSYFDAFGNKTERNPKIFALSHIHRPCILT